ncbi:MAG TPA: hypothetical protein VFV50_03235 [Bdellovibrionales bacterium]|nr:hypothetical protein [Bdellovibrionales bacterium]
MKTQKILSLIVASLLLANCAQKDEDAPSDFSEVGSSLEGTLNSLGAFADDMGDSSSASALSTAMAPQSATIQAGAFCERAAAQSCQASGATSTKSATYNGCVIPFTAVTATGDVGLAFNNNSCSLSNAGDSVTRTYDVTLQGYFGATLRISSESHQNYEGTTLGGGGTGTRTAGGWELNLHGQHRVFKTPRGIEVGNVSLRTTTPVLVTGTLSKVNRVINSGVVEVAHNRAKITAIYTPSNLTYNSSCCYPVSGSLNVTWRGAETGSADIAITGCGTAKITHDDGTVENKTFKYCE